MNSRVVSLPKMPSQNQLLKSLSNCSRALPIHEQSKQHFLTALHHPQVNAHRLAKVADQDPALSLQLIFATNRLLQKQDNEARYLHHCISLLGFPQVEQIVKAAPTYKDNPGYEEQLNQSWIAADLSKRLKLASLKEEESVLFFSCLAVRFHELALWSQFPERMQLMERLKANPAYDHEQVEHWVLGISLNDLGKQLAPSWPLPNLTRRCWQTGFHLEVSGATEALHLPNCLKLSHVSVSLGSRNWFHPETLNAQSLLAQQSRASTEEVVRQSHQSAVHSPLLGWYRLHSANRLLQQWDYQQTLPPAFIDNSAPQKQTTKEDILPPAKPKKSASKATSHGQKPPVQDASVTETPPMAEISAAELDDFLRQGYSEEPTHKELFEANLEQLIHRAGSFSDLNQLLLHTLATITDGLAIKDAAILVLNSSRSQLRTQYCRGNQGLLGLRFSLNEPNPNLFDKLLQKRASLHITSKSSAQTLTQVPAELAEVLPPEGSAFMPLFHRQQPLGIAYIHASDLDTDRFNDFKTLCTATCNAISELARHRYRTKTE